MAHEDRLDVCLLQPASHTADPFGARYFAVLKSDTVAERESADIKVSVIF